MNAEKNDATENEASDHAENGAEPYLGQGQQTKRRREGATGNVPGGPLAYEQPRHPGRSVFV